MDFSLTTRQLVFLFYIITLLFSCVLGVRSSDSKPLTCCPHTSAHHVPPNRIAKCAYTEKSRKCLEAYVFSLKNGRLHCSSVKANKINETLATLEKNGISCLGRTKS